MTKRHEDVFDAVLSGVPSRQEDKPSKDRGGARFLKRGNAISDRLSGEHEEKTLHWVDPARCRMWDRHNRDYSLLTAENCGDLIEGIRAQGRQEFPAIVRRIDEADADYEVICGARRHFAVTWLQGQGYSQFKYLIEVRDLTDEEAFRLADIENREREDISDYERAVDYASAVKLYYGGQQKAMAERLEVSAVWLSRYLELARLPSEIVAAFPSKRDLRELHARTLKPLLKEADSKTRVMGKAKEIAAQQALARAGNAQFVDAQKVVAALKLVASPPKQKLSSAKEYSARSGQSISVHRKGRALQVTIPANMKRPEVEAALQKMMDGEF